jgi:hypothetical protein
LSPHLFVGELDGEVGVSLIIFNLDVFFFTHYNLNVLSISFVVIRWLKVSNVMGGVRAPSFFYCFPYILARSRITS